jgi:hypothetical protein
MTFALSLMTIFILNAEVPAKISYLTGTVTVQRGAASMTGVLNTPLYVNDVITTADNSTCEVQFANYSLIRLSPNSSIKIERKEQTKKGVFHKIFASLGEIVTKVTKLNKNDQYEVRTDVAQAYIRGTTFKTSIAQDGASQFAVLEGKLKIKSLLAGAKEYIADEKFKAVFGKGKAAPILSALSEIEINGFKSEFKEFLGRSAILEDLRSKAEKELQEQKEALAKKTNQLKKSCIFW